MIQSKDITTRNKERDSDILNLFQSGQTLDEIGKIYSLTPQAIGHIVRNNKHLLKIDAEFEKLKRVNRLNRIFSKIGDNLSSKKDVLNVISELRHEIEGDNGNKVLIQNSITIPKLDERELAELIAYARSRALPEKTA